MAEQNLIPPGNYIGKAVPGTLKVVKADKKGTQGYEGQVEITQKGPWTGHRLLWRKYNTDGRIESNLEQCMIAGCQFPNGNTTDVTGWGDAEDVTLVVEHEKPQLKDPADPSKGHYPVRAECAWIQDGIGGRGTSEITDAAEKAAFQASSAGALAAARAKRAGTAAPAAVANDIPRNADGTAKF